MDPSFSNVEKFEPDFVKILVKYNPQDSQDLKKRQQEKLKKTSDFCHQKGFNFLLEVLVLPQFNTCTREDFDSILRPKLTVEMIRQLQKAGVEPDVWKLEGMDEAKDYAEIVKTAKRSGRKNVGIVILGRGESEEKVEQWLEIGAKVEGVIGFAVGRTIFWNALERFKNGEIAKEEASEEVGMDFENLYEIFKNSQS